MGFGNTGLFLTILEKGVQLYIDGTFSIVTDPFDQFLVIMDFNEKLGVCVPMMYILMSAKTH